MKLLGVEEVCFDVRLTSELSTNTGYFWRFGSCQFDKAYVMDRSYTEICCLPRGEHTLTCGSIDGTAWTKIFLLINGHRFCDDFTGYEALRTINVSGIICSL